MLIAGIDTGKVSGYAIYDTETKIIHLSEYSGVSDLSIAIIKVVPDIIVFEKIVNYGLGMPEEVIRAITDIGYIARVCEEYNIETYFYTKAEWRSTLFGDRKKHTISQQKKVLSDFFSVKMVGEHAPDAAALIFCHLNRTQKEK